MIKNLIISSLLFTIGINAQSVGINTEKPNQSAVLHISPFVGDIAKITANVSNGKVTGFNIINPGSGYTVAPEILLAGGGPSVVRGGVRATATAEIDNQGRIIAVNLTNEGSSYYTAPEVTVIARENRGFAIPRVDLHNIYDNQYPIQTIDNQSDGLLVYNGKDNNNNNTTFWYDASKSIWQEGVDANRTPKISIFEFTEDEMVNHIKNDCGNWEKIIKNPMFKEPISNILGVRTMYNDGYYTIALPNVPGNYIIEVNLNINTESYSTDYAYDSPNSLTPNSSKAINSEGFQIMGYFLEITTSNDTVIRNTHPDAYNRIRKEIPILSKIGSPHKATWFVSLAVNPTYEDNTTPLIHFALGRMCGSTHYQPVKILSDGSFIKIQQIN